MDAAAFTDFFVKQRQSPARAGLFIFVFKRPSVTNSNDDGASSGDASGGGGANPSACGASGDGANPSAGDASPNDGGASRDDGRGPSELLRA